MVYKSSLNVECMNFRDPGMFRDIDVAPNPSPNASNGLNASHTTVINAVVRELCEILDMVVD
jgi:hypothetical protein